MKSLRRHKSLNRRPEETTQAWINRVLDSQYPDATPEERVELERQIISRMLRGQLAFFGVDTSEWTDDELEAGLKTFAELSARTSFDAATLATTFVNLASVGYSAKDMEQSK